MLFDGLALELAAGWFEAWRFKAHLHIGRQQKEARLPSSWTLWWRIQVGGIPALSTLAEIVAYQLITEWSSGRCLWKLV